MEKTRVKDEASRRTVQGLRRSKIQLLPTVITEAIKNDFQTRNGFTEFLDDVGVIYPNEPVAAPLKKEPEIEITEPAQDKPSKRKIEEEDMEV